MHFALTKQIQAIFEFLEEHILNRSLYHVMWPILEAIVWKHFKCHHIFVACKWTLMISLIRWQEHKRTPVDTLAQTVYLDFKHKLSFVDVELTWTIQTKHIAMKYQNKEKLTKRVSRHCKVDYSTYFCHVFSSIPCCSTIKLVFDSWSTFWFPYRDSCTAHTAAVLTILLTIIIFMLS